MVFEGILCISIILFKKRRKIIKSVEKFKHYFYKKKPESGATTGNVEVIIMHNIFVSLDVLWFDCYLII